MYSTFIAYLLWLIGGFGTLGFHRFYLGKIGTGILYLLTGGLGFIGSVYDFFTLPMQVRDRNLEERYRRALVRGEVHEQLPAARRVPVREDSIERIILRTAKKNSGIASPAEVALEGDISLDDAKKHLEQLVSKGFAEVRVSKSGKLLYVFPDFVPHQPKSTLEDF